MADQRAFEAIVVFEAALVVGRHWREQDGVNAMHVDELADAVERYDAAAYPEPEEPPAVKKARQALRLWRREGVCPSISGAEHACSWTCRDCDKLVPPTRESDGEKIHVRCRVAP